MALTKEESMLLFYVVNSGMKPLKLETSLAVVLHLMVSVLWSKTPQEDCLKCLTLFFFQLIRRLI